MRNRDYKIDFEIYVVFILAISISVFNAIYSSLNITKNQEMSNKIMAVDIPSLQALENMNLVVTRSEMYTTNWTYIASSRGDKEKLRTLQQTEYPALKNRIMELMSAWKDPENVKTTKDIFLDFEILLSYQKQIMEGLVKFDDYQDPMKKFAAEEIVESEVIPRTTQIIFKLNGVISNKKSQAEALHIDMRRSYRTLIWSVLGIAIMVVMVILFAAFYLSNNMIVPLMKLKNSILQMGKGEVPDVVMSDKKNAVGLMTEAVRKLSDSIKRTERFAHDIGEGNFKIEYEPLGPHDELGSALIQMRDRLSQTNEELSNQSLLLQSSEEELKKSNNELKENSRVVKEQNERLEQAREALSIKVKELELNSKYKSEFLANMSHELRTPLNSVLILAKLLAENKNNALSEKEIEYAKVIHKSGNDLLMLINDVLDLSKIEAGKIELRLANESVKQIKDDMKSLFEEVANQKKIDFSIEIHSGVPDNIVTDKLRIEQIIKNLLSNAFKFTGSGGSVKFKIKQADRTTQFKNQDLHTGKGVIEFSVSDSGIGIPLDQQQVIFEAFQQADGSINRKYGGTGLGLSISRMLVTLLGGELQLISEKDKGSTFFLFVPLESRQNNQVVNGDKENRGKEITQGSEWRGKSQKHYDVERIENSREKYLYQRESIFRNIEAHTKAQNNLSQKMYALFRDKKILIIDDDMRNVYALTSLLEQHGVTVIAALDVKDAWTKIAKHKRFDMILIDSKIPENLIREIRSKEDFKSLPLIIQAPKIIQGEKEKWIQAGASDHTDKQVGGEELLSLMSVWLYKD
jgi:signal transduction histidine kinase/vacuolar-type H+-ATPase subunit F/Vma7